MAAPFLCDTADTSADTADTSADTSADTADTSADTADTSADTADIATSDDTADIATSDEVCGASDEGGEGGEWAAPRHGATKPQVNGGGVKSRNRTV